MPKLWKKEKPEEPKIIDAEIIEEKPADDDSEKPTSEFDHLKDKAKEIAHEVGEKSKEVVSNINKKAPGVADNVLYQTKKFASAVAEKTEEAVLFGKLKLKLHNNQSLLNKTLKELGGKTFDLLQAESVIKTNAEVIELAEKITGLKENAVSLEKEIADIGHDSEKTAS